MNILIVSGQFFSYTNRGIDTITQFFIDEGYKTTHLMVGLNKLKKYNFKQIKGVENFEQLFSKKSYFSYLGIMGKIFPKFFLELIKRKQEKLVKNINFRKYDLIILETGIPLFLIDIIPEEIPIVLRISDPLDFSFNSNRKYFLELEKKGIERARLVLIAHKKLYEYYSEYSEKIEYWKTGFDEKKIEEKLEQKNLGKELFYMGNTKVDFNLLEGIMKNNQDIKINIIGNHKYKSKNSNLKIHGYLDSDEYLKYLKEAKCYIMPFSKREVEKMKMLGMTSKFYVAMQLGKPILVRRYGEIQKDNLKLNIFTYDSLEEVNKKLTFILNNEFHKTKEIEILLEQLKNKNRKKELEKILKKYNLFEGR